MGWSDVSLCLSGPTVQDLQEHFSQRWNFIYDEKYNVRKDVRYSRLPSSGQFSNVAPPQHRGLEQEEGQRGFSDEYDGSAEGERGLFGQGGHGAHGGLRNKFYSKVSEGFHQTNDYYQQHHGGYSGSHHQNEPQARGVSCQITRSSGKWSHGLATTEVRADEVS